jgi:DNA-binding MarR family transcriptional regulator
MSTGTTDRLLKLAEADRVLRVAETWGVGGLRAALVLARILEIGSGGTAQLHDVRRACAYSRSAFAALVAQLVRDGYIERTTDEFDRRNARLAVTRDGWRFVYEWCKSLATAPDTPPPDNRRRVRSDDPWRWRFGA